MFVQLPTTILKEILLLLTKRDRLLLQLVSQQVRGLLLPLIWKSYDEELVKDCFERPLDVNYLSKYGTYINCMHVNLSYSDLLLSLVHCPNLTTISFIKIHNHTDLIKFLLTPSSLAPKLTKISVSIEFELSIWPTGPSPFIASLEDLELLFASPDQKEVGLGFLRPLSSAKLKRLLLFTYKELNLNLAVDLQTNFPSLTHLYVDGCFVVSELIEGHVPKFNNLELLDIPANGASLDKLLCHYFGKPSNLPKLTNLALTDLPPSPSGQPNFIFDQVWPRLATLHAEVTTFLPAELVINLRQVTNLRLNFKTEEAVGSMFNILSSLNNLQHLSFSGKIQDEAFDFSPPQNCIKSVELISRSEFGQHLVNWMVTLNHLEVLKLPRIRVSLPSFFELPFGIHFPNLINARVYKDNLEFNSWIIHSSPKLRNLKFSS